jgi:cobalt-zinc-cadmium efflux system membrane fusion protein
MAFRMVEVVAGLQDEGYTEVKLLNPLPDDTQIVMNTAYYLLSDLKKDEAGDDD